jgi:hypothetical protein
MHLIQIRTIGDAEEGTKGHYYNYEYAFVDDIVNEGALTRTVKNHVRAFVQGTYRYGHDDEEYWDNDESDNRPDEYSDYERDRYWLYVNKKVISELEGNFEE